MNCIIPFESKVKFNGPVKEICSISLEHEITKNDSEVLGNFLISGTYKEHELSVNTSEFKFTIPFNVELTTRIENDSLEFSIDNFTYEVNDNEMTVLIDYIVSADDVREEIVPEMTPDVINESDPLELLNLKEEVIEPEEKQEITEVRDNLIEEVPEMINPEVVSGIETENDYMTYHIHIVKESETLESIALSYKLVKDDIERLNNISNISVGDKLIIPISNE